MICFCVLAHPSRPAVLLKNSAGGWSLPSIDVDSDMLIAYQTEQVRNLLRKKLGCDAVVLQKLVSRRKYHCLELDLLREFPVNPLVYQWHSHDRLAILDYDSPETGLLLESWLEQSKNPDVVASLSPWQKKGWFQEAQVWIHGQLGNLRWRATGPVLQVKGSQHNSCLLYLSTSEGDVFFKAGSPMLPVESRVTAELAQLFPGEIPEFAAVDHERNWMLMRDFGINHLGAAAEHYLPVATKRMAEIQIETATQLERWAELGCERWDEHFITEQLVEAPKMVVQFDQGNNFIKLELIDALAARIPAISERVTDLFNSSLPLTLVHVEFHPAHMLVNEPGFIFHDWDGCVVSHPCFSLQSMLFAIDKKEQSPDICAAFAEPFLHFADEQRLREQIETSGNLFWLFVYLNMRRHLLPMAPGDHRRKGFLTHMNMHLERGLSLTTSDT